MKTDSLHIVRFADFRLDRSSFALYYKDELVDGVGKKALQVLAVLLENANELVSHQEVIDRVWGDGAFGVRPDHVNHYVSKLRSVLTGYGVSAVTIESVKGRGYILHGEVAHPESVAKPATPEIHKVDEPVKAVSRQKAFAAGFALLAAVIACTAFLVYSGRFSAGDEEAITKLVRESQLYESLVLYADPASYDESQMDAFWTAEVGVSTNADRRRIREAVKKMQVEGRRYGPETRCEQLDFQSIEVNKEGDFALVRTLEKWFVAEYGRDGNLLKNKFIGPYFVSYAVKKDGGRWLIEKSTTARTNRPIPRLEALNYSTQPMAGKEFRIAVAGADFEPETTFLEITGPGCPENRPCKISNAILREFARMTDREIVEIPLTLSTGTFALTARNGDSLASNPLNVVVP